MRHIGIGLNVRFALPWYVVLETYGRGAGRVILSRHATATEAEAAATAARAAILHGR